MLWPPGGYVKTKCVASAPTSSSPPINPPPCQNGGEHERRFQALHTRTRINLRATPAMVNPRVSPLGSRAQGMNLSLLFSPLLANNQSQPHNNTPFARRLKYDGALSVKKHCCLSYKTETLQSAVTIPAASLTASISANRRCQAESSKHLACARVLVAVALSC